MQSPLGDKHSPDAKPSDDHMPSGQVSSRVSEIGAGDLKVAVVGAGISGLTCAQSLADYGLDVTVFEKSRGTGGRMATRRTDEGPQFDHGAQYFTARAEPFQRCVRNWIEQGCVARWEGRICSLADGNIEWKKETTDRFVAVPTMNTICKRLATELHVQFRTEIRPPLVRRGKWHMVDSEDNELGEFDYFITSAPAQQSAQLLAQAPQTQRLAMQTRLDACWAVMLAFDDPLELPFDGAFVQSSPLSWIARNNSKPGRQHDDECWVLHASAQWSDEHLEDTKQTIQHQLERAFWQATGARPRPAKYAACHRWRYAISANPLEQACLFDETLGVGACGDWCSGPRVEGAFLSGMAMARRVVSDTLRRS